VKAPPPPPARRRGRRHRVWPGTVIALVLLWILVLFLIIHHGDRLPRWPASAAPAPSSAAGPAAPR
jgi:hypothetical protein